ncbi:MAG: PAAR domain-containing protein [Pseudomonadota bacterium]
MLPQARVSDVHVGPACTVAGPMPIIPPCAVTVLVGGLPAARLGDMCVGVMLSPTPPPVPIPAPAHPIAKGSLTVLIQNQPAARMGDLCSMGGTIIKGHPTVLTGG